MGQCPPSALFLCSSPPLALSIPLCVVYPLFSFPLLLVYLCVSVSLYLYLLALVLCPTLCLGLLSFPYFSIQDACLPASLSVCVCVSVCVRVRPPLLLPVLGSVPRNLGGEWGLPRMLMCQTT